MVSERGLSRVGPTLLMIAVVVAGGVVAGTDVDGDGAPGFHEELYYDSNPLAWEGWVAAGHDDVTTDGWLPTEADVQYLNTLRTHSEIRPLHDQLTRDQALTATERQFITYLIENPHNIQDQILEQDYHSDGEITVEELEQAQDGDGDGLILALEQKIGTDPTDKDTDDDGLFDGWEYEEGVIIATTKEPIPGGGPECCDGGVYKPLPGADPLHKDIYLHVIPVDGNLSDMNGDVADLKADYANSYVTNPDGENGITLHISYQQENPEDFEDTMITRDGNLDGQKSYFASKAVTHPKWGTHYFLRIEEIENPRIVGASREQGYNAMVQPGVNIEIAGHELDHLTVEIQEEKPVESYEPLLITNPAVAEAISENGIQGLPTVEGEKDQLDNNFASWWMPENDNRADEEPN